MQDCFESQIWFISKCTCVMPWPGFMPGSSHLNVLQERLTAASLRGWRGGGLHYAMLPGEFEIEAERFWEECVPGVMGGSCLPLPKPTASHGADVEGREVVPARMKHIRDMPD